MTGQGPIDERRYLEHNAVKITKHWRDTVGSLSASYQGGSVSLCVVILMMLYQPTCWTADLYTMIWGVHDKMTIVRGLRHSGIALEDGLVKRSRVWSFLCYTFNDWTHRQPAQCTQLLAPPYNVQLTTCPVSLSADSITWLPDFLCNATRRDTECVETFRQLIRLYETINRKMNTFTRRKPTMAGQRHLQLSYLSIKQLLCFQTWTIPYSVQNTECSTLKRMVSSITTYCRRGKYVFCNVIFEILMKSNNKICGGSLAVEATWQLLNQAEAQTTYFLWRRNDSGAIGRRYARLHKLNNQSQRQCQFK